MCIGGRASAQGVHPSPVEALGVRNGQLPSRWSLLTTPTSGSSLELVQKSNRPSNEVERNSLQNHLIPINRLKNHKVTLVSAISIIQYQYKALWLPDYGLFIALTVASGRINYFGEI